MGVTEKTERTSGVEALLPPFEIQAPLRERAVESGWPLELVQRCVDLRLSAEEIEWWFTNESLEGLEGWVGERERLTFGTLRGRAATWADEASFSELWANAPEDVGEWEVTVERHRAPFAQFQLNDNFSIRLVEDRGVVMGCGAFSYLNAYVAGEPMAIRSLLGWRVRREFRGSGVSRLLQRQVADPPTSRWVQGQFFYVRWGNLAAEQWIDSLAPGFLDNFRGAAGAPPGEVAEILQYPGRPFDGGRDGIRKAEPADLARCAALINRTHRGLDLFRPYTSAYLHDKLLEWSWAPKPEWWQHVYSWDDYWVLCENGTVVACAGLWDRGRYIRETWRLRDRDEQKTISTTALLDFGFARGREDAMARLIAFLVGETARLERGFLLAPLQFLPRVAARLASLEPVPERRGITWNVFGEEGFVIPPQPPLRRPYVDLAYW